MYYRIVKHETTPLPLKMDDEQLEELIDFFISEFDCTFSYNLLCNNIKYYALQNNLFEKEQYTEYSNIEISNKDHFRITKYIWEKIWNHKLIINFDNTIFGKDNHQFNFIKL